MVRVRVFQAKFSKKFACLQFKFIKEILVRSEPKFHKPFLVKMLCQLLEKFYVFLAFQQDFVIQPYYAEVASAIKISRLRYTCYKAFYLQVAAHRPHHSCNRAKYPQDAPQQKLSILLLKPRHSSEIQPSFRSTSVTSAKFCQNERRIKCFKAA